MRDDVEANSTLIESWNDSRKDLRLRKAAESQSMDITLLASTPMHDRLTFESSEAVNEKMDERLRRAAPGKLYQGWTAEIENQVARQESEREEYFPLVGTFILFGCHPLSFHK